MSEPKYIKVNGLLKKNPKYLDPSNPVQSTLLPTALLPISTIDDVATQNEGTGPQIQLAESTMSSVEILQDSSVGERYRQGCGDPNILDGLSTIFAQYEIPIGMINKLLELMEFHILMLLDDSPSMNTVDSKDMKGKSCSRWREMQERLYVFGEILSYIPCKSVTLRFLNRESVITMDHKQHTPTTFRAAFVAAVDREFQAVPTRGSTPIVVALEKVLHEVSMRMDGTSLYLLTDGEPDGGQFSIDKIENMLMRRDSKKTPLTFVSCSGNDDAVQWMKELEERVPNTAEVDDFETEREEVLHDQTDMFPYTKGFWLICQLVGAMNPDDLDALDESIPLSLFAFNNMMGRLLTPEEYRAYYKRFLNNPRQEPAKNAELQRYFGNALQYFETVPDRNQIEAVRQYKAAVLHTGQSSQPVYPPPPYSPHK